MIYVRSPLKWRVARSVKDTYRAVLVHPADQQKLQLDGMGLCV
jgi:hypothetical protein